MKKKESLEEETDPNIKKFLLKDTISLRNENQFTEVKDLIHPLTFTDDMKKNPDMNLIPVSDKLQSPKLSKRFYKLYK